MKHYLLGCLLAFAMAGCSKNTEAEPVEPTAPATLYVIPKGAQYCNGTLVQPVETASLHFKVRFDSSAVYTTAIPENQYDINKLYGFSDNDTYHHQFSARFGWRWSDGALRLFAYVYNSGVRQEKELGIIAIGAWIDCSIGVGAKAYQFSLNGAVTAMPRTSTTAKAKGYMLFPYFGGDETAPHEVRIEIKNL